MENVMMNQVHPRKRSLFSTMITLSFISKRLKVDIIAHLFIILFLYTGIAKLMEFDVFQEQLMDSPILAFAAPVVAWGLPITEFLVSILLFIPKYRLTGLYSSLIMMTLFTGYVGWLLVFAPELPCSCGGILAALSWPAHLAVNIGLVVLAIAGIIMAKKLKKNGESL